MTASEVYQLARNVGFPPVQAVIITAIACRESGFHPKAFYGGNPPGREASYGLLQINTLAWDIAKFGLTSPDQLYDASVNLQAGFVIWNGDDANFDRHWYINHSGMYQDRFKACLPEAKQAAMEVENIEVGDDDIDTGSILSSLPGALLVFAAAGAMIFLYRKIGGA